MTTTVSRFTASDAASLEVDRRLEQYMAEKGCSYREALLAVLDHQLSLVRKALIRHGHSEWVANDIIETALEGFRKGDPGLDAFGQKWLH